MDHTPSKADRTRRFIIESTAGIFNRQGFAGTSLSDLTSATNLTKGSIYGNFESKEAVALAAFDYNYERINQRVRQRLALEKSHYDKLMIYIRVYEQLNKGVLAEGGCPVLNTAVEADDTNPLLKEKAARALQQWKKNIQAILQAGIAAGEFIPATDTSRIALSLIALIEGGIMIAKLTGSQRNLDQIMDSAERMLSAIKA